MPAALIVWRCALRVSGCGAPPKATNAARQQKADAARLAPLSGRLESERFEAQRRGIAEIDVRIGAAQLQGTRPRGLGRIRQSVAIHGDRTGKREQDPREP